MGFENPKFLNKALKSAPTLYEYQYIFCGPDYSVKFTKSSEEVELKEDINRQRKDKMQVPFNYSKLNKSYKSQDSAVSNDFNQSYSKAEFEAKPS